MLLTITAAVIMQTNASVTTTEDARLQKVLSEIGEMDRELEEITEYQDDLAASPAARRDEIASLKARYPGLKLAPDATVRQIYRALYEHRMIHAQSVRDIAVRKLAASRIEVCRTAAELEKSRQRLEITDEYLRADLRTRIELRKSYDTMLATKGKCP